MFICGQSSEITTIRKNSIVEDLRLCVLWKIISKQSCLRDHFQITGFFSKANKFTKKYKIFGKINPQF